MSRLDNEFNNLISGVEFPSDAEVNEETRRKKIGNFNKGGTRSSVIIEKVRAKLTGRLAGPSPKKGRATGKAAWNKGIPGPKLSDARKQRISETSKGRNTPYIYHSSKGTFTSMTDMFDAFATEYKPNRIKRWVVDGKNGFSRTLKPIDA